MRISDNISYYDAGKNGKSRADKPCSVWNGQKEKMVHTKTEGNTFTKEIGQTVYGVRYYFNEDAKETMQEKINRMLVIEVNQPEI